MTSINELKHLLSSYITGVHGLAVKLRTGDFIVEEENGVYKLKKEIIGLPIEYYTSYDGLISRTQRLKKVSHLFKKPEVKEELGFMLEMLSDSVNLFASLCENLTDYLPTGFDPYCFSIEQKC